MVTKPKQVVSLFVLIFIGKAMLNIDSIDICVLYAAIHPLLLESVSESSAVSGTGGEGGKARACV